MSQVYQLVVSVGMKYDRPGRLRRQEKKVDDLRSSMFNVHVKWKILVQTAKPINQTEKD